MNKMDAIINSCSAEDSEFIQEILISLRESSFFVDVFSSFLLFEVKEVAQ